MSDDEKPKSAVELAMERMRKRDADNGTADAPPTDKQRAQIAEVRSMHAAKTAELEILHRSKLTVVLDPAERELVDADYRDTLRRLNDETERKVSRIRRAAGD